jgi:hypothetical protein
VPVPGADELHAARADLDAVIADIRRVDGYEHFLAEPDFADVLAAAQRRPIVYLAAADAGGRALLVQHGTVVDAELAALRTGELLERVKGYVHLHSELRKDQDPDDTEKAWRRWAAHLDDVSGWLWDAAMRPVLDLVGDDRPDQQVALVPCGLLGLLPLHAAWTSDDSAPTGRRYALDHAVWTYTANARALAACYSAADLSSLDRSLVVADPFPRPPGLAPLPAIRAVSTVVKSRIPGGPAGLIGDAVTCSAVRTLLPDVDIAYFGCHGTADMADPLRSRIVLGDGDLTLDEILRMRLRARLAVVAACETAMVGTGRSDDVVALPTGLVQAGAAAVVASMWGCDQLATALVLVEFFRRIPELSAAVALRDAQCLVRDSTRDELARAWEKALDADAPWLPAESGDALLDLLLVDPPGDREPRAWSGVETWAALSYTGA